MGARKSPYPDTWGLLSLLGAGWAVVLVGITQGLGPAIQILTVVVVAAFAAFTSFFLPAEGKNVLLWAPSFVLLIHQFVTALLRGPLPGGFYGQGTGSIAFGHLMAIGFLISYLGSMKSRNLRS